MHASFLFEALDHQSDVRHLLKRGGVKSRTYSIRRGRRGFEMIPLRENPADQANTPTRRTLMTPLLRRVG